MNSRIHDFIANENTMDVMHSIELFFVIFVAISLVGVVCLAVA
jgi:hypothetical protein